MVRVRLLLSQGRGGKKQVIKQNVVKTPWERAVCQLSDKQMNAANL